MRLLLRLLMPLIVLLVLAIVVAWYFPASLAYRMAGEQLIGAGVTVQHLSGTVRKGRAEEVFINGFPVGSFSWHANWRGLLRGDVGGQWRLDGPLVEGQSRSVWEAQGHTARLADGTLQVRDMTLRLPAMLLQSVLDIPALHFLGEVQVQLDQVQLRGLGIHEARGTALWTDAGVSGQAQARFGPIQAHFATRRPGHVIGEVQDRGGSLMVDGQFELAAVRYHADVILRSRNVNDPVTQMLHYVGQAMPDGGSLLSVRGELKRHADPANAQ